MKFAQNATLITGAAGGVGQALARLFARAGARLMLSDREEAGCARIAEQARALGAEVGYLAGNPVGRPAKLPLPFRVIGHGALLCTTIAGCPGFTMGWSLHA